jgi:aspartate/methionine/tyrosine aminotransferase
MDLGHHHIRTSVRALLDHPQAIGHHFDYRKAIPILGLEVSDLFPQGGITIRDDYADFSYMVSHYGPPQSAVDTIREAVSADTVGPYPPDLFGELRELVAIEKFGRPRDPSTFDVIGTEGAQGGIGYTFLALLSPGDEVVITDPGYMHFASCAVTMGAVPVPVPLTAANNFRLTAEDVERRLTSRTRLLVLCDPINPFGTVQDETSLREIVDLCRRRNVAVLNNITHAGHQLDKNVQHIAVAAMEGLETDHVISITGLSKSHGMAGVRMGFLAGHPTFVKPIAALRMEVTKIHTNYLGQLGAVAALKDTDYKKEATDHIRGNLRVLLDGLADVGDAELAITPEYGFSTMLDVAKANVSAQEVTVALFKRKCCAIPGDALGDVGATRYIRLNFSQRDRSQVEHFVNILPDALAEAQTGVYRDGVIQFFTEQRTARGDRIAQELLAAADEPAAVA